jgi:hypothetical protein
LACSPPLSFGGLSSNMMYELLQDYFTLDDFENGFDFFSEICGHIAHGHVLPFVLCLLVAS